MTPSISAPLWGYAIAASRTEHRGDVGRVVENHVCRGERLCHR